MVHRYFPHRCGHADPLNWLHTQQKSKPSGDEKQQAEDKKNDIAQVSRFGKHGIHMILRIEPTHRTTATTKYGVQVYVDQSKWM